MLEWHVSNCEPVINGDGSWSIGDGPDTLILDNVQNEVELGLLVFRYAYTPEQREWAFWHLARLFWCTEEDDGLGLVRENKYVWHPWADKQVYEFCRHQHVGIGGAANSSKSHTAAAWAILNWLCDPENVMCLLTSTSITDARRRVWKSVDMLLTPLTDNGIAPTKVRANGTAPYHRPNKSVYDGAGLFLIAGAKDSDRNSTSKLIGTKAGPEIRMHNGRKLTRSRLIIIFDELSELSPAIVEALKINLMSQKPQTVEMSNPKGKFDPFGEMVEPVDGWDSVDLIKDSEWKTKMGGIYIRLDGEKSPNIERGEEIWPFLPTQEYIEEQRRQLGENSAGYLRMVRAVFYSAAGGQGLYSNPELRMAKVDEEIEFVGPVIRLAGIDIGETDDGDKTPVLFASLGYTKDRQHVLQFDKKVHYLASDDTRKDVPRPYQIIWQFRDLCEEQGLKPDQVSLDDTLGQYAAILEMEWGPGAWAVNSNGGASDRQAVGDPEKTNKDVYASRSAEMWQEPRTLMRNAQIRNLPGAAQEQMTTREPGFGLHGTGIGGKIGIEPKKKYRSRTGASPDEADTAFLIVDMAIARYGLRPGKGAGEVTKPLPDSEMSNLMKSAFPGHFPGLEVFDVAGRSTGSWLE